MERKYLGVAETAKLVRAALKESFPGVKFSVRSSSYSGGASISVNHTDGPNSDQVKQVLGTFEGAYFDGMIDYKGSRYHTLDGQPVSFGANFVSGSRDYSDQQVARGIAMAVSKFGGQPISVDDYRQGRAWSWSWRNSDSPNAIDMGRELNSILYRMTDRLAVAKSATVARVAFAGDDGYGAGTVGNGSDRQGEQAYVGQEQARQRAAVSAEASPEVAAFIDPTGALRKAGLLTLLGRQV